MPFPLLLFNDNRWAASNVFGVVFFLWFLLLLFFLYFISSSSFLSIFYFFFFIEKKKILKNTNKSKIWLGLHIALPGSVIINPLWVYGKLFNARAYWSSSSLSLSLSLSLESAGCTSEFDCLSWLCASFPITSKFISSIYHRLLAFLSNVTTVLLIQYCCSSNEIIR